MGLDMEGKFSSMLWTQMQTQTNSNVGPLPNYYCYFLEIQVSRDPFSSFKENTNISLFVGQN